MSLHDQVVLNGKLIEILIAAHEDEIARKDRRISDLEEELQRWQKVTLAMQKDTS